VQVIRLDEHFASGPAPHVLKIDVEGAELAVLEGAGGLLGPGGIRDVAFEDHKRPPTPAMRLLEERGYSLFQIERSFFGPVLSTLARPRARHPWEPPSYLATLDPARARERTRARGWQALRRRPGR
jgi:hypothetical protein